MILVVDPGLAASHEEFVYLFKKKTRKEVTSLSIWRTERQTSFLYLLIICGEILQRIHHIPADSYKNNVIKKGINANINLTQQVDFLCVHKKGHFDIIQIINPQRFVKGLIWL